MLNHKTATPDLDLFRVDLIRAKLDDDDYIVDTLQIADKVIDLELALSDSS